MSVQSPKGVLRLWLTAEFNVARDIIIIAYFRDESFQAIDCKLSTFVPQLDLANFLFKLLSITLLFLSFCTFILFVICHITFSAHRCCGALHLTTRNTELHSSCNCAEWTQFCVLRKQQLTILRKCLASAKRPWDCHVLYLRLKSSLSISDMTSFGCRDQGRDQGRDIVRPVLWMPTWRNSRKRG